GVKRGRRELWRTCGRDVGPASAAAPGAGPDGWAAMMGRSVPVTLSSVVVVLSRDDDWVSGVVTRLAVRPGLPGWALCAGGCWGPPDCLDKAGVEAFGAPAEPTCWGRGEPSELESPPEDDGSSARAIPLANATVTQIDS